LPADRSTFRIDHAVRDGRPVLLVQGVIDEHADLSPITTANGDLVVNMRGVRRINSFGVRIWIDAIRKVPAGSRLSFIECSPPVVDQLNMVGGFLGHGILESFIAPMACEECDEQLDHLVSVESCKALGGRLPALPCPRCGRAMEIDDLEEQYLLFVRS
jgi:anti-anti-sigma regulatory factor